MTSQRSQNELQRKQRQYGVVEGIREIKMASVNEDVDERRDERRETKGAECEGRVRQVDVERGIPSIVGGTTPWWKLR